MSKELKNNETELEAKVEESEETKPEGRYKVIETLEPNLWTYGCPIIIEEGVLERDLISNKNRLTLKFTNIYEQKIRDVHVTIYVGDDDDNYDVVEHSYMALGQNYLETKGRAAKIVISNEDAREFRIEVSHVRFEDGRYWSKEGAILESAGEIEDLDVFAQAKNKDYNDMYISAQEAIAQDNTESISHGIEMLEKIPWFMDADELLRDADTKYEIAKQTEARKKAREDSIAERQKAVKKRFKLAITTIIVIAIIAVFLVVAFFIPNGKYKNAEALVKKEKYSQAAQKFEKLHGFRKSEDYIAQCYYQIGLQKLNESDEKKASEYFNKSFDAAPKSDYGVMAGAFLDYYKGVDELASENYDEALKLFTSSANAASDFNLINKASAGMAQISYRNGDYKTAWTTIKNVFAKDSSYSEQYGEYGYGYAKSLVDAGSIDEGVKIYNSVSKYTKSANLNESIYKQAVTLAEQGKIKESMDLLNKIKANYPAAKTLYEKMYAFEEKVQYWIGTWKHTGKVNGKKKTYTIYISRLLYKGEMCLKIKDQNNKFLGFEIVISSKNHVTQIQIGTYQLHFKLKKFHNQKFTYTLKGGKKMVRKLKYEGHTYKTKYKKKK